MTRERDELNEDPYEPPETKTRAGRNPAARRNSSAFDSGRSRVPIVTIITTVAPPVAFFAVVFFAVVADSATYTNLLPVLLLLFLLIYPVVVAVACLIDAEAAKATWIAIPLIVCVTMPALCASVFIMFALFMTF